MTVERVMNRAVACCRPFDKLLDAAARMDREGLACLFVVADDVPERVVGVLSDRHVTRAAAREETPFVDLEVRHAMGAAPASSSPGDSVLEALRLMRVHGSTRLPVTDPGGGLVGVVSLGDIASGPMHTFTFRVNYTAEQRFMVGIESSTAKTPVSGVNESINTSLLTINLRYYF